MAGSFGSRFFLSRNPKGSEPSDGTRPPDLRIPLSNLPKEADKKHMVYPDFSSEPGSDRRPDEPRIAPVFDRLLAFFIDFLIFSPIISLIGSAALRDLRIFMLTAPDSVEAELTWLFMIGGFSVLAILLETLFVCFTGSTPGQKFLLLEVRSWPSKGRLTLMQALSRATLWWFSMPLVLPLLGVYTNPWRRAFHDRATDTVVVTRKEVGDPGPLEMEARFFLSWGRMVFLLLLMVGTAFLSHTHSLLRSGYFSRLEALDGGQLCLDIAENVSAKNRLDRAVASFLTGQVDRECLEKEADYALWKKDSSSEAFANLAKGLALEDRVMMDAYLGRACELEEKGEACGIVRFLSSEEDGRGDELRRSGLATLSSRVLLLRETIDQGQLLSALGLVKDLRGQEDLSAWLAQQEVRAMWKLKNRRGSQRAPASDETRKLIEDFESRYELR